MSVKVFIAMAPPLTEAADDGGVWETDNMQFVKDGFSLPALIVPELWLLWHRMWLPLLGYLGYRIVIGLIALALGDGVAAMIALILAFLFALEANNLRRWSLERKGWRIVGETIGRNRNEAEFLYFRDRANRPPARPVDAGAPGPWRAAPVAEAPDEEPAVFGLFPDPEPER